jgi:hypothetical protein
MCTGKNIEQRYRSKKAGEAGSNNMETLIAKGGKVEAMGKMS